MRFWVDIYDATYSEKVGNRLIPIAASYKRKLDEAGTGRATFAIDPRSLSIIQARRIVEVWLSDTKLKTDEGTGDTITETSPRKIGAFVIETIQSSPRERTITVRGPGVMSKLIDTLALPGLYYEDETVADVLSDLAALAGWTVDAEAELSSELISIRFAGENVLRALSVVAETKGIHIRESATNQQIEAGSFGDVNSHAEFAKGDAGETALFKDAPMVIQDASIIEQSSEVVNKIYVYTGGDGDAAGTLELSDRSFVDSESANGRSHWFIQDSGSISLYGQIARRLDIKRLNPTSPSDAAEVAVANAGADAGKAWLDRNNAPYELLSLHVQNVNETVQPGDKCHVRYLDVINLMGVPYQERDIDAPYWVMAVEENISSAGLEAFLDVANIDRYETNAADIVVGMVDSINVQNVNIQPYPAPYYWSTHKAPIDDVTGYLASFVVNPQTVRLNQAIAYIFRSVWKAVSGVAEAGGDHYHLMFSTEGTNIALTGMSGRVMSALMSDLDPLNPHTVVIPNASDDDMYTGGASGTHTHDFTFTEVSVDDEANLLSDVTLKIDGDEHSTGLFPEGNDDTVAEVDITEALKAGTLRGFHDIEVECGSGRGDIYVVIFLDVDISRVRS
jgi:hypothetical protein